MLQLVREIASIMQEFTQSGGVRPFGVSLLIAGFDDDGPQLYQASLPLFLTRLNALHCTRYALSHTHTHTYALTHPRRHTYTQLRRNLLSRECF